MLAYLSMMAPRLVELGRVLKPTGSIYLHCDPTASHYLKLLMDAVFGPEMFQNEIVWKRTSAHSDSRRFGRIHDILFMYWSTQQAAFNVLRRPLDESYVNKVYTRVDEEGRRYRLDNIMAPRRPWPGLRMARRDSGVAVHTGKYGRVVQAGPHQASCRWSCNDQRLRSLSGRE